MEKSRFRIFNWAFRLICITLAIYMSSMQIRRYLDNKDTSSFHTKEFNQSPLDLYPSFTYCFEDKTGGIYDKRNFTELTGMTREEYQNVLMGEKEISYNKSDIKTPNILEMEVDSGRVPEGSNGRKRVF